MHRTAVPLVMVLTALVHGQPKWHWTEATELRVEGRGFSELAAPFDRLPAKAKGVVRDPVWRLSQDSAGLCVRFVADSPAIAVRWKLRRARLGMVHMPATGVSGLDLYGRDATGRWRWIACSRPGKREAAATLARGLTAGKREYLLYLPLYNGIDALAVGVPEGVAIEPGPARPKGQRPIVFYGTSITHGASASRPGMAHVAQIGRRLDREVVNLGFSGNGKMEPELAELVGSIDAAVYVLDCLPNMNAKLIDERYEAFVRRLRELRPQVPLVLVEDRFYQDGSFRPARRDHNLANHAAMQRAVDALRASGMEGLHILRARDLLGTDTEGTVDGSHPTDLGFYRQANAFERVLKPILPR